MAKTPDSSNKLKAFVSYSRKDVRFALRIADALEVRGLSPTIDTRNLPTLEDWRRELLRLIRETDVVVFIISPNSLASPVCAWEVQQVSNFNKRLAPIVLEVVEDDRIPSDIARINYLYFDAPRDFDAQADKLAEALQTDLTWIKEHTRLTEIARRWVEREQPSSMLLRGQDIEDAEHWIASRPRLAPEPTKEIWPLITASRTGSTRRRNTLIGSLLAGLALTVGLAAVSYWQWGRAIEHERTALKQRDQALLTQSRFLAYLSNQETTAGDATLGTLYAIEALVGNSIDASVELSRPYVAEAEQSLYLSLFALRERLVLNVAPTSIAFSDDARHIFLHDKSSGTPLTRAWDLSTGHEVRGLPGNNRAARSLRARSPTFELDERNGRLKDKHTGYGTVLQGLRPNSAVEAVSLDRRRVLTSDQTSDSKQIWDAESGELLKEVAGQATLSVNGQMIAVATPIHSKTINYASAESTIKVWDLQGAQEVAAILYRGPDIERLTFAPDNTMLVTVTSPASDAKIPVRVWDVGSKTLRPGAWIVEGTGKGGSIGSRKIETEYTGSVPLDEGGRTREQLDTIKLIDTKTGSVIAIIKLGPWKDLQSYRSVEFITEGRKIWIVTRLDAEIEQAWRIFDTTTALVGHAKQKAPRCLTGKERHGAFLEMTPPAWCIEMGKWPYQADAWKKWLVEQRAGADPVVPSEVDQGVSESSRRHSPFVPFTVDPER